MANFDIDIGTKWTKALTGENSLGNAMLLREDINEVLTYVCGDKYSLSHLLEYGGHVSTKMKIVGNRQYHWYLMGNLGRRIRFTRAASGPGTINNGLGQAGFFIYCEEDYYNDRDIIRLNSGTHIFVSGKVELIGNEYRYPVQCLTPTGQYATTDFEAGATSTFVNNANDEWSQGGYGRQFMPEPYTNYMGIHRWGFGISGSANNSIVRIKPKSLKNKSEGDCIWFTEEEFQQQQQWRKMQEYNRMYGQKSVLDNGITGLRAPSGREVITGDGLLEQIKYGLRRTYVPGQLTEQFLLDFLSDLLQNSAEASNKKWVVFCGMEFYKEFQRAIKDFMRGQGTMASDVFLTKKGQKYKFGTEFDEFHGILGASFLLIHTTQYDDPIVHGGNLHPVTGRMRESGRATFVDFSDYGGEKNITLMARGVKGRSRQFVRKILPGMEMPHGMSESSDIAVTAQDGFKIEYLSETSLKVTNPYACGELMYA